MVARPLSVAVVLGVLTACAGGAEVNEATCAPICESMAGGGAVTAPTPEAPAPAPASAALTEFEQDILSPVLEDIRGGVRPFTEEGIGICKGSKSCDEYLGREVGELAEGKYMVMAEVRVPNVGDPGTWKLVFDTECTTIRKTTTGETTSTSNSSREYDVRYAGESRGYRLMPLRTIESPATGERKCTWKITAPHADGDQVYEGSWSVPDKG